MTEKELSRRQVLHAASVAGGLGIASGAGTQAFLLDDENFSDNAFGAGTLELLVAAKRGATPCTWSPTLEEVIQGGSLDVRLEEKSGSIGLAVAVCDNPGRVTLDVTNVREVSSGTLTSSEGTETGPARGPTESRPEVSLVECDDAEPSALASGTLASLADRGPIPLGGERSCKNLGKLENNGGTFSPEDASDAEIDPEDDDRFIFQNGDEEVVVEISDRAEKTDEGEVEVTGIELTVVDGSGLCKVDVKGGNGGDANDGVESHSLDCVRSTQMLSPPENDGGQTPAVSHVVLYTCDGESRCIDCTPHTVFLEWDNLRTTTDVEFDLTTKQCRHGGADGSEP